MLILLYYSYGDRNKYSISISITAVILLESMAYLCAGYDVILDAGLVPHLLGTEQESLKLQSLPSSDNAFLFFNLLKYAEQ